MIVESWLGHGLENHGFAVNVSPLCAIGATTLEETSSDVGLTLSQGFAQQVGATFSEKSWLGHGLENHGLKRHWLSVASPLIVVRCQASFCGANCQL